MVNHSNKPWVTTVKYIAIHYDIMDNDREFKIIIREENGESTKLGRKDPVKR